MILSADESGTILLGSYLRKPKLAAREKASTTVSTKGQVILPKPIRDRRRWKAGTRLLVEETPEGVLLKPEPLFPPTRPEDVYGVLKYSGPAKTIEEMDEAIAREVKRRRARGRY
ncbi:MAG TPA: AbrB/MazE/SpoVT family DNA-binding domain-containing protein [Stellaceae bacterium]|jgi:AbrB family looped-hinge helix DNA binding protein|nr:AbrB/MazE/SpoVT family DNA-binding domain-containing protein [Stellaceae bacterium]